MKIQKGDLVTVEDWSYSRFIINGRLFSHAEADVHYKLDKETHQFKVIDVNIITHPVGYQHDKLGECNNTIIQSMETGIVGFIEERFLQLVTKHQIVIDGKTIEISHESYVNLKKQLA